MSRILDPVTVWRADGEYLFAREYWDKAMKSFWVHHEISLSTDVYDWKFNLDDKERYIISSILKTFTQSELLISDYWTQNVNRWFQKPEICQVGLAFGLFESIHIRSYSYLNESLGLEHEFSEFLEVPEYKAKIDRLVNFGGVGWENEHLFEDDDELMRVRDIALSLAVFSGFTEGVSLFSSFAALASFKMRNLLKGMGQIIQYSIRDECHSKDTEILTNRGWVKFPELKETDLVLQYNQNTKKSSFVLPLRIVKNYYKGDMVLLDGKQSSGKITPNHQILVKKRFGEKEVLKVNASDIKTDVNYSIPTTTELSNYGSGLTDLDRLLIAIQADGHLLKWTDSQGVIHTRGVKGGHNVQISLTRERNKERLESILNNLNIDFKKIISDNNEIKYSFHLAEATEDFDWVFHRDLNLNWVSEFIDEIVLWDGHVRSNNSSIYCSTSKKQVDIVQAIGVMAGYKTYISVSDDSRKESYKRYYRLSFHSQNADYTTLNSTTKTVESYDDLVYCVSVPDGNIITRYKDSTLIAGNCLHSDFGCRLFNLLIKDYPEIWTDDFKKLIYQAARDTIALEDHAIELIFKQGDLPNLAKHDLKTYIRYRANSKLMALGLKKNWKNLDSSSLERMTWFETFATGLSQTDFFSGREVNYQRVEFTDRDLWEGFDR